MNKEDERKEGMDIETKKEKLQKGVGVLAFIIAACMMGDLLVKGNPEGFFIGLLCIVGTVVMYDAVMCEDVKQVAFKIEIIEPAQKHLSVGMEDSDEESGEREDMSCVRSSDEGV